MATPISTVATLLRFDTRHFALHVPLDLIGTMGFLALLALLALANLGSGVHPTITFTVASTLVNSSSESTTPPQRGVCAVGVWGSIRAAHPNIRREAAHQARLRSVTQRAHAHVLHVTLHDRLLVPHVLDEFNDSF